MIGSAESAKLRRSCGEACATVQPPSQTASAAHEKAPGPVPKVAGGGVTTVPSSKTTVTVQRKSSSLGSGTGPPNGTCDGVPDVIVPLSHSEEAGAVALETMMRYAVCSAPLTCQANLGRGFQSISMAAGSLKYSVVRLPTLACAAAEARVRATESRRMKSSGM